MPVAETELNYSNPFELLIAVILSAQCTDKRINMVTPALFNAYPTPEKLALVGWLGYSAYDIYDSNQERSVAEVNFDSVTEYLNGLSETE